MDKHELCNILYDTLMQNTKNEQLNLSEVADNECCASDSEPAIRFTWRGNMYELLISECESE